MRPKLILEASTFVRRANSGRAEPPMVLATSPTGDTAEVYLKSPLFHERKSRFVVEREWMAAKLGEALGLPCAHGCKVHVSRAFIQSIPDEQLAAQLIQGPDIVFGSLNAGSGWSVWTTGASLPRNSLPLMVQTYIFDTIIQNWDRCIPNPNLLVKGDQFLLIDHEEAFVTATGDPAERDYHRPPWQHDAIENYIGEDLEHPFWRKLKPKTQVSFDRAIDVWKSLPDDIYQLYASDIPGCWDSAATLKIATYLEEAIGEIDEIASQIKHNYEE